MEFKINVHKITLVIHAIIFIFLISTCFYIMYKIFFTPLKGADKKLSHQLSTLIVPFSIGIIAILVRFYKKGLSVVILDNNQINFRSLLRGKLIINKNTLISITAKTVKGLRYIETVLEIKTTTRDNTIFFTPKVYLGNPDKLNLQFKNYIDGIKVLTPQ